MKMEISEIWTIPSDNVIIDKSTIRYWELRKNKVLNCRGRPRPRWTRPWRLTSHRPVDLNCQVDLKVNLFLNSHGSVDLNCRGRPRPRWTRSWPAMDQWTSTAEVDLDLGESVLDQSWTSLRMQPSLETGNSYALYKFEFITAFQHRCSLLKFTAAPPCGLWWRHERNSHAPTFWQLIDKARGWLRYYTDNYRQTDQESNQNELIPCVWPIWRVHPKLLTGGNVVEKIWLGHWV